MLYCYCLEIVFIDSVSKGKVRTQDKKTRSSIANKVKRKITILVCVTLKRSRRLIQNAAHYVSVSLVLEQQSTLQPSPERPCVKSRRCPFVLALNAAARRLVCHVR